MKHLNKYLFALITAFLLLTILTNAQHQMNHSKKDTIKQMHQMMNDSTKMQSMNMKDHECTDECKDGCKMKDHVCTDKCDHSKDMKDHKCTEECKHDMKIDKSKAMMMDHDKMDKEHVMKAANIETKIWNAVCPVKGGEVDPETPTVQYKGKNIGFCCPGCDSKFSADPEKYMKNLSEDGKKFVGKK